jgi:hypothetical protein
MCSEIRRYSRIWENAYWTARPMKVKAVQFYETAWRADLKTRRLIAADLRPEQCATVRCCHSLSCGTHCMYPVLLPIDCPSPLYSSSLFHMFVLPLCYLLICTIYLAKHFCFCPRVSVSCCLQNFQPPKLKLCFVLYLLQTSCLYGIQKFQCCIYVII